MHFPTETCDILPIIIYNDMCICLESGGLRAGRILKRKSDVFREIYIKTSRRSSD